MSQETPRNVNQKEIDLIKRTFKDNEMLLQAMRAVFFGLDVTQSEKDMVRKTFASDELLSIIKKRFCPTLDKKSPIGQVQDVWIGAEQMIFGVEPHTVKQAILYKKKSIDMTRQGIECLVDPELVSPSIDYNSENDDEMGTELLARNQYIRHIEEQLNFLNIIAQMKDEPAKGAGQNSNK